MDKTESIENEMITSIAKWVVRWDKNSKITNGAVLELAAELKALQASLRSEVGESEVMCDYCKHNETEWCEKQCGPKFEGFRGRPILPTSPPKVDTTKEAK